MKNDDPAVINILAPSFGNINLLVEGDTSLICNRLDEQTMKTIKQPGKDNKNIIAKAGGIFLSPEEEYEKSKYYTKENKPGFPLAAFKKAVIECAKGQGWWSGTGITGKLLNASFQLIEKDDDPIVEIKGTLVKREDKGRRPAKKTPAMIYRCEFSKGWRCILRVKYNKNLISLQKIVAILNTAGYGIGIGDWRPERDGSHGMFTILGTCDERGNLIKAG